MKLLGVTGGIGMGKTTVAQKLAQYGAAVVDTDDLARQLTQPGQPVLAQIAEIFGNSYLDSHGGLNRAALADLVFNDDAARAKLEGVLHPPIRAAWLGQVEEWKRAGRTIGAVIIPLLFETNAQGHFDATICVACSASTQEKRLLARGWTRRQIAARTAAQWTVEKKITHADFVIWTDTTLETEDAQARRIIDTVGTLQKIPACG